MLHININECTIAHDYNKLDINSIQSYLEDVKELRKGNEEIRSKIKSGELSPMHIINIEPVLYSDLYLKTIAKKILDGYNKYILNKLNNLKHNVL